MAEFVGLLDAYQAKVSQQYEEARLKHAFDDLVLAMFGIGAAAVRHCGASIEAHA